MSRASENQIRKSSEHGYTIQDVKAAGFTLEPMVCVNAECPDPTSGNVVYSQSIGDACCEECGEWQLEIVNRADGDVPDWVDEADLGQVTIPKWVLLSLVQASDKLLWSVAQKDDGDTPRLRDELQPMLGNEVDANVVKGIARVGEALSHPDIRAIWPEGLAWAEGSESEPASPQPGF